MEGNKVSKVAMVHEDFLCVDLRVQVAVVTVALYRTFVSGKRR